MGRLRVQLTVLLAMLGLLVAAWGATIFLGARNGQVSTESRQFEVSRFDELRRAAAGFRARVVDASSNQRDYLLTGDDRAKQQFHVACTQADERLAMVGALAQPWPSLVPMLQRLRSAYASWEGQVRSEVDIHDHIGTGAAMLTVDRHDSSVRFAQLRARNDALDRVLADLQVNAARQQRSTYRETQRLALDAAVMILATVTLIFFYLRRAVGAPAAVLRWASSRLAGGDLTTPIELSVPNDLGAVDHDGRLRLRALSGFEHPERAAERIAAAHHELCAFLAMKTLVTGQVVGIGEVDEVPKPATLGELAVVLRIRALALVPLVSRGSFVGLLALFWEQPHQLDQEQEALLGLAGNHIAGALAAALRYEEAERGAREARAVFYAIADGVLLTDPNGRVTAMNHALEQLGGWTEAQVQGMPYAEVMPVEDEHGRRIPPEARPLAKALATGEPASDQGYGVDLVTRDGGRVPVAVSSAPILDPRGEVMGGVDVVRDVSREREIDEVKSALISTVSHELRTPLTLIHGFAELLVLRDMPVERQRAAAEEILEASRRLARLIDDLLSVSRMESGRLVLDPRPLDLASVVERVLSPFRAMATRHAIRAEVTSGLPVVWGDPDKVDQILTNLVGNAIKYSPAGGEVVVSVSCADDEVRVSVRDQGIGMSPRDMGQLFEKFYRVDRDEVRRAGGTGLGLYITKRLVEMHGGHIWAESWPGEGSEFSFTLPGSGELAGEGRR